jgi:hypothetical protein
MKRLWLIPMGLVVLVVPAAVLAGSGEGAFNSVVRSIETRYHVHATRIPFLGLMSFIAGRATHGGVGGLHIAEFESFSEPLDGDELNAMVEEKLGAGWERMIRETSRHGTEQTLIFTRPEGNRMGMFIVDADGHDLDVVQVSVDPEHLDDDIGQYRHHHHNSDGDSGDSEQE